MDNETTVGQDGDKTSKNVSESGYSERYNDTTGDEVPGPRKEKDERSLESSNDNADRNRRNSGVSRRKVLSQSVAGAIGLSAFGFGADVVGAKSVESRPLVEELDGPEAKRVLSQLRRTNEYRELGSRLRERGARVQFTPRHTTVIRATQSVNPASVNAEKGRTTENDYHTVELAYTKVLDSNTDEAFLTIGRDAETGVIEVAGLEFVQKEVKGPEDLPVDAEEDVSPTKVPVEVTLVDATGKGVETETLDFDDIVTSRISSTGDGTNAADVHTSDIYCFNCKVLVGQLCYYGCGAPIWILCGLLAVPTGGLGGLVCGAFVTGACAVIGIYGCDYTGISKKACQKVGQC